MTSTKEQKARRPIRIQRKRTKGWNMPPNTVYVGRPTRWGNPFKLTVFEAATSPLLVQNSLNSYRRHIIALAGMEPRFLTELRAKNLACWCPLDQPCHADILLELANA